MGVVTYLAAWRSISARVLGIEKAALVHAHFLAVNSASPHGADKTLQKHCEAVLFDIQNFMQMFEADLPVEAKTAFEKFSDDGGLLIKQNTAGDARKVRTSIVKLIAFESEMTYCLDSSVEQVRFAVELAFMHLQRSIVVDEECRKKWDLAFVQGETSCERLGALHLFWHGIWAFKVHATGGRTDLVYQEPMNPNDSRAALGMVLTEWKLARQNDALDQFKTARIQSDLYSSGVLAGVELATHRYLVVVTKKQIVLPNDFEEGGVLYRHVNIAVEPETPSIAAKK